ncbi:hypothetical protein D3C87_1580840 [compost metagenome]
MVLYIRIIEGQQSDEQRHGKAYPAQHCRPRHLAPAGLRRKLCQSEFYEYQDDTEDADNLAEEQAGGNAHRQRFSKDIKGQSR